jgi:hypothetical protein
MYWARVSTNARLTLSSSRSCWRAFDSRCALGRPPFSTALASISASIRSVFLPCSPTPSCRTRVVSTSRTSFRQRVECRFTSPSSQCKPTSTSTSTSTPTDNARRFRGNRSVGALGAAREGHGSAGRAAICLAGNSRRRGHFTVARTHSRAEPAPRVGRALRAEPIRTPSRNHGRSRLRAVVVRAKLLGGEARSLRRVSPNVEEVPNAELPIWPGSTRPSPAQRGRDEAGKDSGHEVLGGGRTGRGAHPTRVARTVRANG